MLGQNKEVTKKYIKLLSAIRKNGGVECEQVPHIFFPEDSHGLNAQYFAERKLAIEICRRCPLQAMCADYAITAREPFGVWGGTTPQDR
jgi:hypothetical protein